MMELPKRFDYLALKLYKGFIVPIISTVSTIAALISSIDL
jgi:hypothetical protein